jgi:hypothetical protein
MVSLDVEIYIRTSELALRQHRYVCRIWPLRIDYKGCHRFSDVDQLIRLLWADDGILLRIAKTT